jgi:hypothetical protein
MKYSDRVTQHSVLISVFLSIAYFLFIYYLPKNSLTERQNKLLLSLIIAGYLILSIIFFRLIPQTTLNVDRFSVITSFWDSYFNSEYVYYAKSFHGNLPGPMPFYFILALPFYLIGELGFFSIMSLITFVLIIKYSKLGVKSILSGTILLVISAFYAWETISRSNIFLNSNLVLFSILFFGNSVNMDKKKHILLNGIIVGLLLSTRNVLIIPFVVLFLYALKCKIYNFMDTIKISAIILLSFGLTFVPFVINHWDDFKEMNPFIIQSSFLMPTWLSITCVLLSISTVLFTKSILDVIYFSGLYLFITIATYLLYQIFKVGFDKAIFHSKADISYLILCLPFFLFYIISDEIELIKLTARDGNLLYDN